MAGFWFAPDAGVKHPKDLEGRKVGVRAYSVTTGVWTRGILIDEYGLDSSKVTWVVDDEEHVTQLKLPRNVVHAPEGRSLADMMADGELAAGFDGQRRHWPFRFADGGMAGAGGQLSGALPRCGSNWKPPGIARPAFIRCTEPLSSRMKSSNSIPGSPARCSTRFPRPRRNGWRNCTPARPIQPATGNIASSLRSSESDPLPYGTKANLPTMEALADTAFKQKLTPRRIETNELFVELET